MDKENIGVLMKNASLTNFFKKSGSISTQNQPQMCKVFRRKPNLNASETRIIKKTQSKPNVCQTFCYISPNKIPESHGLTQMKKDNSTFYNHHHNTHAYKNQTNTTKSHHQLPRNISYTSLQRPSMTQISECVQLQDSYREQIKHLKQKEKNLSKQIDDLVLKSKMLKQQNKYLYQQIEEFQIKQEESTKKIENLTTINFQKDRMIENLTEELSAEKTISEKLNSIIEAIEKSSFVQNQGQDSDITDCSSFMTENSEFMMTKNDEKSKIEHQLESLSEELMQLRERLKYSEIQAAMFQRLKQQNASLYSEKIHLKLMNKKLIKRLQSLTQKIQNIENKFLAQRDKQPKNRHHRYSTMLPTKRNYYFKQEQELELQFSPEQ